MLKKDKHPTSSLLFAVAAVQAVVGVLVSTVYSPVTAFEWVFTFGFALFAALAILARRAPAPAAVIAALLYGTFLALQATISVDLLMSGLIVKVPAVLFLLFALATAMKSGKDAERDEGAG